MARGKKEETESVLFEIEGYAVHSNTIYTVNDKVDYNAPPSFQEAGLSKVPGTGDSATCPFNKTSEVYNHGFLENSPMYYYEDDKKAVSTKVKTLVANVLKPFCEMEGLEISDVIGKNAVNFWDNYLVSFDSSRRFNTANAKERLELYIAILSGRLCPKGFENKSRYINASYTVDNVKQRADRNAKKLILKTTANKYASLLSEDVEKAKTIFTYATGHYVEHISDSVTVLLYYSNTFDSTLDKMNLFVETYEDYEESNEKATEMTLYRKLVQLERNSRVIVKTKEGITYNDVLLGLDLKSSARRLASQENDEMRSIAKEIILA